jgi:NAD(P)H-flavin reductase
MSNPIRLKGIVSKIVSYGEGIYQVFFQVDRIIKFKPGQFLHLTLDEYDPASGYWPESRVFSIASLSGSREIEIVYSVKGVYTKRMSAELKEWREVWIKLPYGDFIIENYVKEGEDVFLIAGGTGISPFISFLRKNVNDLKFKIHLYYGIRGEKFYLYKEFLESIRNEIELKVVVGMMDIDKIVEEIKSCDRGKYFISGPPIMIEKYKNKLIDKGIVSERIIIDEW